MEGGGGGGGREKERENEVGTPPRANIEAFMIEAVNCRQNESEDIKSRHDLRHHLVMAEIGLHNHPPPPPRIKASPPTSTHTEGRARSCLIIVAPNCMKRAHELIATVTLVPIAQPNV